jgi:hypothetical protein
VRDLAISLIRTRQSELCSQPAILDSTKQNKINKNKMKVIKPETYKTIFGWLYQPFGKPGNGGPKF